MDDQATHRPGPTGWGFGELNLRDYERRLFGRYASQNPEFYSRNPIREPISQKTLQAVRDAMQLDGMYGGVSLRHIEQVIFGDQLNWLAQIIGSCVGSSFMRLATWRMLWESFVLGDPEEIFGTKLVGTNNVAPFAPYGYRAGRKLGGLNGGDGSFCSVQIEGAKEYGILTCSAQGLVSDAFPEPQAANTYRRWGNSDTLLRQFAQQGRQHRLNEAEKVRDAGTAKELVTEHFKPLQICSMWAFTPSHVHSDWTLRDGSPVVIYKRDRRTSWAHALSISGIVEAGGQWFAIVVNSWGQNAHKNGDWFAIPLSMCDEWIRDAECMSIGDIELTDNVLPEGM